MQLAIWVGLVISHAKIAIPSHLSNLRSDRISRKWNTEAIAVIQVISFWTALRKV
jgi:hypothetical protein